MPPKKNVPQISAKNKAKAKAKSTEDKSFGMKNKNKSKKVQEQISQLNAGSDAFAKKKEAEAKRKAEEKKASEEAKREAAAIYGIQQQKVPFGTDPKSILCEFFKKGLCLKGPKCKFSHDINIGRKDHKKDLYVDAREEKEQDTMDNWDEEKLRKVITSKHGNPKTTTDKICKYFIDAVENGKYGWFWSCPNGGIECKYRHSLPPGFVLKTKEQKKLEKLASESAPKISLEEFIEMERTKLDKAKFTPITVQTFAQWKNKQLAKKADDKRREEQSGRKILTGREIVSQKFADKYYTEEDNSTQGTEWDLSQFKEALPETDENIRDYGDGEKSEESKLSDDSTSLENTNSSESGASETETNNLKAEIPEAIEA